MVLQCWKPQLINSVHSISLTSWEVTCGTGNLVIVSWKLKSLHYCITPGSLLLELKEFKEAERIYRDLLRRNPENKHYYQELEKALQLGKYR